MASQLQSGSLARRWLSRLFSMGICVWLRLWKWAGSFGRPLVALVVVGLVSGFCFWFEPAASDTLEKHYRSALEQVRAGQFRDVREKIKDISQHPNGRDLGLLLEAEIFLKRGRPDGALRILRSADQDGPERNRILLCAGQSLYQLGRFAEAVHALEVVAAAAPDEVEAHRWLSAALYDLGANYAAIAEIREIIRLAPNDYRAHHFMGVIYNDVENFGLAAQSLRRAAKLSPPPEKFAEVVEQLTFSLVRIRQFEEALEYCDLVPESAAIRLSRAECLWRLGRFTETGELLRRCKSLGDHSPELSLVESHWVEHAEGAEAAEAILRSAIREFPNHAALFQAHREILQQLGKLDEANAQLQSFLALQARVKRLNELSAEAERSPTDPDIRDQLAVVCESLGKMELAAMWRDAARSCRLSQPVSPK